MRDSQNPLPQPPANKGHALWSVVCQVYTEEPRAHTVGRHGVVIGGAVSDEYESGFAQSSLFYWLSLTDGEKGKNRGDRQDGSRESHSFGC